MITWGCVYSRSEGKKERTNWAVDGKEKKSEKVASLRGYREEKKNCYFYSCVTLENL